MDTQTKSLGAQFVVLIQPYLPYVIERREGHGKQSVGW